MGRDYYEAMGETWNKSVIYIPLEEDKFVWCTEQVIFNPYDSKNEHGIIVDIMDERNKFQKYNIELGRNKRLYFRQQFIRIWNAYFKDDEFRIKET
jgi:hypothetical protein